jgi:hydrophobe/amphiphile efflux-1 (HAE1) family protein
MKQRFRSGGLAAWSIQRPVSVVMLALTVVVVGGFSLDRLGIDLLPHIIYPEVRVRILDPGVPANIMEDQVTRQLEEQLSITEGAISVQSTTSEGASRVDIGFPYGTDIDIALRDASTRLDRAKRFLPDTIDPPIIYKRDPSQIAVLELAVSSKSLGPVKLREWVDYDFSRWFLNLPGVAAAEVGGGNLREIQIIVDQERLASFGLTFDDLKESIQKNNLEAPGGRLLTNKREISTRALGRFKNIEEIKQLPLWHANDTDNKIIRLSDVARVIDSYEDERLRVRLNKQSAIKLSIQKQPQANTVEVVDVVLERLAWLKAQGLLPDDVTISRVSDQSTFVRNALRNASMAAISGAILAMLVVYLFLGSIRRTLIIGTAIPLAIMVTFIIMSIGGLTLNIMTLGGIALGVGLLIDSTIVMLENITRHQREGEQPFDAAINAATEINSAIVASTSTNLAAILPFLFITGLVGLLFSELIFTLTAAISASLLVALTLVPSLGARIIDSKENLLHHKQTYVDRVVEKLKDTLGKILPGILKAPWKPFLILVPLLLLALAHLFIFSKQTFLPTVDEGQVRVNIKMDAGTQFNDLDTITDQLESLFLKQKEVDTVFTTSGGFIFGRTERTSSNSGSIYIQLHPGYKTEAWITAMRKKIAMLGLAGVNVRLRAQGVRGIRLSQGDDDISIRVQGNDLGTLAAIGGDIVERLDGIDGLRNLSQTYEEVREEVTVQIDKQRAADLNIQVSDVGDALRIALEGQVVSEYLEGDRAYNIRLRLPANLMKSPDDLENILVGFHQNRPIRLIEVAQIQMTQSPSTIMRDNQRRIVEVSASLTANADLSQIMSTIKSRLDDLELPEGYSLYDGGATKTLKEGQQMGMILFGLAIFLVFVVMAIQYESLLNPVIILLSIPFAVIGVAFGLWIADLPDGLIISMPVWLGLIMLAGIVVNNAIVLVEQVEIERENGLQFDQAVIMAAKLRLRPILMTTLTTVFGMMPLAFGLGRGAEMLQPLAIVLVWGLFFSMIVSLIIVPALYKIIRRKDHPPILGS